MFSAPDSATTARMRTARTVACRKLDVHEADGGSVWGYAGRTLSGPVTASHGRCWLRLVAERPNRAQGKLWDGPRLAHEMFPKAIPRPMLHNIHDWQSDGWAYRAELYEYTNTNVISRSPVLEKDPVLPDHWWTDLRDALDALPLVPVDRIAVREEYIRRTVPEFTGRTVDTIEWSTAHGDFHWANLTGPPLRILDWEGFGRAPVGFDAALLFIYSLNTPMTADRVRATFAHVLGTPTSRVAELTVCAQVLQAADRTPFYASLGHAVRAYLTSAA
ncbi:hypothetical protein [Streptomyces sp. NBC_00582]|uniref:hypothetical protein n=1 Tax=Streptomyces sp. NBC_00582 TaxID=2975783 RepID=UPI002E8233E2|nr:hypothetical protein [Streptomyces sp. NBC_00582]WUB60916.1 hypothetical protein OG852_11225 [Streptomyces sp. NBC_00582]